MNSLTSLLVFVEDGPASDARLEAACDLADRFDACVIGASASEPVPPMYDPLGGMGDLLVALREAAEEDVRRARVRFEAITAVRGVRSEWREALGSPATFVALQARSADLIIVGPRTANAPYRSPDPADVLMAVGRPVLVVPEKSPASCLDSPALVAWKDTREAQRALASALPLLREASEVRVVEIIARAGAGEAAERVEDVAHFLARHDVRAVADVIVDEEHSAWGRIHSEARTQGARLIVAGGYGHSRLREWTLGGVTQALLEVGDTCVLLAH